MNYIVLFNPTGHPALTFNCPARQCLPYQKRRLEAVDTPITILIGSEQDIAAIS
jgi:hypothetical protein